MKLEKAERYIEEKWQNTICYLDANGRTSKGSTNLIKKKGFYTA
jgi:hypothetical protein